MLRIGYHVSISGSIDQAFDRAHAIGCTAMQIFLSNPRGWETKTLSDEEIEEFRAKEKRFDIRPVFAHMPYLPNPASPKKEVFEKTVALMRESVERCELLHVKYLIAHLGSHLGEGKEKGFERVTEAIRKAGEVSKNTVILLENEAGQRNSVGSQLEDLVELYNRIGIERLGFCLDTCHVFAAGYDIRKKEIVDEVLHTLDISRVHAIHLNDAKYQVGSGLDRHENIGFGRIGRSGFDTFFAYPGIREKAIILETPGEHAGSGELKLVEKMLNE